VNALVNGAADIDLDADDTAPLWLLQPEVTKARHEVKIALLVNAGFATDLTEGRAARRAMGAPEVRAFRLIQDLCIFSDYICYCFICD
jgi:hypothetical protein